ncbi:MAG TPA: hypothetical protein ENL10_05130 [Candidatus Cloacimonetes bacterium]|nr:hypothetical protein [Candidatus Cloacimonadota bacterium]
MNSKKYIKRAVALAAMLITVSAVSLSAEILLWDNDNYSTIEDPEGAGYVGCEYALEKAFNNMMLSYTTLSYLPTNLSDYDMLFITLGHWCFG